MANYEPFKVITHTDMSDVSTVVSIHAPVHVTVINSCSNYTCPYPTTLVLLVSKVNISPISSSDTPALAFGDAKRLSRGRDPFVLILQHRIMESLSHNQIKYL